MTPPQKERIIDQAMQMFATQGIKSVRMDDIAQHLGVSKRTLYELFGDKEGLLYLAMERYFQRDRQRWTELTANARNVLEAMFMVLAGTDGLTTDVQDNSDLRTLELQEDLLKRQLKVANAGRMPTVTAFFTATYTGNDIDMTKLNFGGAEGGQPGDVLDGSKFWWQHPMSAGLQVSIPIFSGLTKMNRSREIKNQISQIGLQRDYARQQIDVEVRAALNDLLTARETMYAQELTVAQARKAYSISDTRYRAGAGTILELNSAQLAQTQAELNFSQAIFDYLTAKAEYDRIVGKEN